MTNSTHLYRQLLDFLRQYSRANDLRHLKAKPRDGERLNL